MIVSMFEQQVGQQLVQQQILLAEADKLGISANEQRCACSFCRGAGGTGAVPERQIYRAGSICGDDREPLRYVGSGI